MPHQRDSHAFHTAKPTRYAIQPLWAIKFVYMGSTMAIAFAEIFRLERAVFIKFPLFLVYRCHGDYLHVETNICTISIQNSFIFLFSLIFFHFLCCFCVGFSNSHCFVCSGGNLRRKRKRNCICMYTFWYWTTRMASI